MGRKRYEKMKLRAEKGKGAWSKAGVMDWDSGPAEEAGGAAWIV